MELLIPGLMLVALMVWASTKIKRNAAAAFESESIVTPDYSFQKPDGFLHVLNDDSGLNFRAYSKEYGNGEAKGIRRAVIEIEIVEGQSPDGRLMSIRKEFGEVSNKENYEDEGKKAILFQVKNDKDGHSYDRFYKIVKLGGRLFEFRIIALAEHTEEYSARIEETQAGFSVK
jgi:hypothetical protein